MLRSQHKTTKPLDGLVYQQTPPGERFWCPEGPKKVAKHFGWVVLYVEQHPDGMVIVTFGDGSGKQDHGRIFEMNLDVVDSMSRALNRKVSIFDMF